MAEDFGDKTEAPTPRRRQEAREQGRVARSADLSAAVLLLGSMILLNIYGPGLVEAMRALVAEYLSPQSLGGLAVGDVGPTLNRSMLRVAAAAAPLMLGGLVVAVLVNIAQVGLYFNTKRLAPNLAALNPMRGLGRMFQGSGWVQLVMNLLKMVLVATVAYSAVHGRLVQILTTQELEFPQIFGLGAQIIYAISIRVGLLLLVLALIDFGYQKFRHEKELKMTKQEIKEEMMRMEGDPKIKQRRRQLAMQMAQRRLQADVPQADVIVTNPTHFAVALKYDPAAMHAPRVIAKGRGFMAQRIREIAIAAGVPILERKPLARALYKMVEVGQEIPESLYSAVAEILAYVYEISGRARQRQAV